MNRLMKAESYRLLNSGHLMAISIVVNLCIVGMQFCLVPEILDHNFSEALPMLNEGFLFVVLLLGLLLTFVSAMGYQNKTAYYEIMSGHKISHMIGSKVIVDTIMITGMLIVFFGIAFSVIALKNGIGDMEDIPLRMFLAVIVLLHVAMITVLSSTMLRSLASVAFAYIRIGMLESLLYGLATELLTDVETLQKVSKWLFFGQFQTILSGTINKDIILPIILSAIIECGVLYSIAYITMKKKLYR